MRQQPGLARAPGGHVGDVVQRAVVAVLGEPDPGDLPAVLGPVAQGEEGLLAAHRRALAGDAEHLLGFQVRRQPGCRELGRRLDEDAVVAAVAAQVGQRQEDLAGVGHDARAAGAVKPLVTDPAGCLEQPIEVPTAGMQQGLGVVAVEPGRVLLEPGQRRPERLGRGRHDEFDEVACVTALRFLGRAGGGDHLDASNHDPSGVSLFLVGAVRPTWTAEGTLARTS